VIIWALSRPASSGLFNSILVFPLVFLFACQTVSINDNTFEAEMLTLTPGITASEINLTWHSNTAETDAANGNSSIVIFARQSEVRRGIFPSGARTVSAVTVEAYSGRVAHRATLSGLSANTEYVYAVSNDGTNYSRHYCIKTAASGAFTFVAFGDAHLSDPSVMPAALGVPGGMLDIDHNVTIAQGWQETLDVIINTVPNVAFFAATGDQVDRNLLAGSPEGILEDHQIKYANLFAPQILRSMPFAPAVGNHEARSNHSFSLHYNLPNEIVIVVKTIIKKLDFCG